MSLAVKRVAQTFPIGLKCPLWRKLGSKPAAVSCHEAHSGEPLGRVRPMHYACIALLLPISLLISALVR